jgi:myo-inositol-1-phosphate synthase
MKLKNTLRYLMGEEQITHFGLDYYIKEEESRAGKKGA